MGSAAKKRGGAKRKQRRTVNRGEKVGLLAADQRKLKVKIDLQEMKVELVEVRKVVQDPRWVGQEIGLTILLV